MNGWLEKWKKQNNAKQVVTIGQLGNAQGVAVDSWKERLPEIFHGYEENKWNLDVLEGPTRSQIRAERKGVQRREEMYRKNDKKLLL